MNTLDIQFACQFIPTTLFTKATEVFRIQFSCFKCKSWLILKSNNIYSSDVSLTSASSFNFTGNYHAVFTQQTLFRTLIIHYHNGVTSIINYRWNRCEWCRAKQDLEKESLIRHLHNSLIRSSEKWPSLIWRWPRRLMVTSGNVCSTETRISPR